jgi:hypothetical protein
VALTSALSFICPRCAARPNQPCVETEGPRKGKTRKAHDERKRRSARKANERYGTRGPRMRG